MTDPLDRIAFRLLILRCQTGDAAAFADLVRGHHDRLAGYLRGLLGRDPADALQDVWLAVWRGLPRLADPEAFAGWAFRIARDRAFAELRRKGFKQVPLDDMAADEPDEVDAEAVRAAVDTAAAVAPGRAAAAVRRGAELRGRSPAWPGCQWAPSAAGCSTPSDMMRDTTPTGGRDVNELKVLTADEQVANILAADARRVQRLTWLTVGLCGDWSRGR